MASAESGIFKSCFQILYPKKACRISDLNHIVRQIKMRYKHIITFAAL